MRIPVYNADATATREAPGQSLRARMNATPFIQAELRKGEVLQTAAQAAGEYANARYKVQVENDLNEAMLGAQETLRTRRDELAKSTDYNRVLDGDNPIWNQETAQIKNELRKKVGKNRYALTQFDAKFGQLELQNRFQLRNDIDRKVAAVAAANQAQLYVNGENTIANSDSLSEIDFVIAGVKLNGDRLVQLGLGKGENLSKQEYAMVLRGTDRALTNFISEQDNSILTLHKIRKVLETEDAGEKLDPDLQVDPEGQKIYHLLRSLNQGDRNKLLKRAGGTATFVDGPTLYEQQQNLVLEGVGKQANDTVTTLIDNVTKGYEPSAAEIETLSRQYEAAGQTQKPAAFAKLKAKVLYFETVIDVAAETKRMNGDQLVKEIDERQDKENKTQTDINVLEYLKSRQSALIKGVNEDAMAWANDQGTITMEPVDYGNFQTQEGQPNPEFVEALQDRLEKSSIVQSVYQRTSLALAPVIMTKAETAQVSRMLNEMGPEQDLAFISSVQAALGPDASRLLFAQLGDDAPQMSFLGGLYASGFGTEAAIDIAAGLEFEDQVKISSITNTAGERMNLDFIMADVFAGYPDTYQAGLDPVIIQSVEAILTYRAKNGEINLTEEGSFNQDDLRKVFSYVMGGSKNGENGGVGNLGDEESALYYFRPDGVSDDQFELGLKNNLPDVFPQGKKTIESALDGNFMVVMVDQTDQREPIYELFVTDGEGVIDPVATEVVGFEEVPGEYNPYQFTYSMLVGVGVEKATAEAAANKAELAKKAVESRAEFQGLTDADLEAAKVTLDAESREPGSAFVSKSSILNKNAGRDAMSEYTLDEWRGLSRPERKEKGLPVRGIDALALGFDAFKNTKIDKALTKKIADIIAEDNEQAEISQSILKDIEANIDGLNKEAFEAETGEEAIAPEAATETVSEDPEINYAIGFAKENGLTFDKYGVLSTGSGQDKLGEAMEGVFPGLWKTDGDWDVEKVYKIEAKIAKFIAEYLAKGENPDWFKE